MVYPEGALDHLVQGITSVYNFAYARKMTSPLRNINGAAESIRHAPLFTLMNPSGNSATEVAGKTEKFSGTLPGRICRARLFLKEGLLRLDHHAQSHPDGCFVCATTSRLLGDFISLNPRETRRSRAPLSKDMKAVNISGTDRQFQGISFTPMTRFSKLGG